MDRQESGVAKCIDECLLCYRTCVQTTIHCLNEGGKHAEPARIRLLADCASACKVSADFLLRGSAYQKEMCALCADICGNCAADCDRFTESFMKRCAQVCRQCAESCKKMS